jgi:iron transport multicopper oxidase
VYAAHKLDAAGPPTAATILINGRGRYKGGPPTALSTVNIRHGKRYRFRIISMMCDPDVIFSVDQHALEIIEVDGEYTQPHTVDSIQIFAGQRYSVIVRANRKVRNYCIRANPNGPGVPGFDGGRNLAILFFDIMVLLRPIPLTIPRLRRKVLSP